MTLVKLDELTVNSPKIVTAYRADDGTLHETEEEAIQTNILREEVALDHERESLWLGLIEHHLEGEYHNWEESEKTSLRKLFKYHHPRREWFFNLLTCYMKGEGI